MQPWLTKNASRKREGFAKRRTGKSASGDGLTGSYCPVAKGLRSRIMRKPRSSGSEGKDRLKALAAAAARAAGANMTTYFADDDRQPVKSDGEQLCATLTCFGCWEQNVVSTIVCMHDLLDPLSGDDFDHRWIPEGLCGCSCIALA